MEPLTIRRKDAGDLGALVEDDTLWFSLGEEAKAAHRATAELMVRDGLSAANETFGLAPRVGFEGLTDRAVRQSVDAYLDDWWLAMERTERAALRSSLQQFAAGELTGGFPELRGKVEGIFGPARGRMIAETETTRLWAIGNEISMDQAGVEVLEWRTANDDRVDEDCHRLNGKQFPVNGGGPRPPLHPRCRCAIVPTAIPKKDIPEQIAAPAELPPMDSNLADALADQANEDRLAENARRLAQFNADKTPLGPLAGEGPIDLGTLRLAAGKSGKKKIRADILNRTVSRHLAAMPPSERAAIMARNREIRVGGAGKNAGVNSFDGSIRFNTREIDRDVRRWAENPRNLIAEGDVGTQARAGYNLIEHELSHGMSPRSFSYQADQARAPVARLNQIGQQRDVNFVLDDWPDIGELQDIVGGSLRYNGSQGWSKAQLIEEGLTDGRARNRLRLKLIDEHGIDIEQAAKWAEDSGATLYNEYVKAVRSVVDEALTLEGAQFSAIAGQRAADAAGRQSSAFLRSWASEVPKVDRADAMARFLMEKWTAEIGPLAARGAGGEILGLERSAEFYRSLTSGIYGQGNFGVLGNQNLLSARRIAEAKDVWRREAASFADELAAANLRPDVDGVLALNGKWETAAELPESMASFLPRRVELVLDRPATSAVDDLFEAATAALP